MRSSSGVLGGDPSTPGKLTPQWLLDASKNSALVVTSLLGHWLHVCTRVQHSIRIATIVHDTLDMQGRGQSRCAPGACSMHILQSP
jgi:hypothetical protein